MTTSNSNRLGLYVHVPFCLKKCAYCDFNAYSGLGELAAPFVDAVCTEIRASEGPGAAAKSCFFGGGTPTYLAANQLASILTELQGRLVFDADAEITSEANPSTVDAAKFASMWESGFNRLSIGVQSFDDNLLAGIDRTHSAEEAECAFCEARRAGFENVSIDLMFGLPGQSRSTWDATLDRAIDLESEHISVYSLTLEPGTRFERLHAGGRLALPDEETDLWMYERAIERLTSVGFEHYEVSNFARPGFKSRHNMVYWRNDSYRGFGPGAVSYIDGRRWTNEKFPGRYIRKVRDGDDLRVESEQLGPVAALAETLMVGLRLRGGIELAPLRTRFGLDPLSQFGEPIANLQTKGWLEVTDERLRLTHRGLLFANDVFLEFLP
jgi:oxygen-independent coproporphyrinogen-3 oxidase